MFLRICREQDREGPAQDHTVSVRGRRCEIGLLAIINLWPPSPKYQRAGRVEQLGRGEPNRGKVGNCMSVCWLQTSKVNFPATGGTFTNEVHEGLNKYMEIHFQCEKRFQKPPVLSPFFPWDTCFCLPRCPAGRRVEATCIICKPWFQQPVLNFLLTFYHLQPLCAF